MLQVKVFRNLYPNELTIEVNDWLLKNPSINIVDRQICGTGGNKTFSGSCYIVIWYTVKL